MRAKINMIGVITSQLKVMTDFYRDALGFKIKEQFENFVEFENEGVRFALSTHQVMSQATTHSSYREKKQGHSFELGFELKTTREVDDTYQVLIQKGATPIKAPANMDWGQRTAFFADPDGNIHELFCDLPQKN